MKNKIIMCLTVLSMSGTFSLQAVGGEGPGSEIMTPRYVSPEIARRDLEEQEARTTQAERDRLRRRIDQQQIPAIHSDGSFGMTSDDFEVLGNDDRNDSSDDLETMSPQLSRNVSPASEAPVLTPEEAAIMRAADAKEQKQNFASQRLKEENDAVHKAMTDERAARLKALYKQIDKERAEKLAK